MLTKMTETIFWENFIRRVLLVHVPSTNMEQAVFIYQQLIMSSIFVHRLSFWESF